MPDGVDRAVRRTKRRLQERAAREALRIAHRGHGDVDVVSFTHEGRQRRRDHDGRDVLRLQIRLVDRHTVLAQHVRHGLQGFERLVRVARTVEADDKAITHELVRAHALHLRDILDARHCRLRENRRAHHADEEKRGKARKNLLHKTASSKPRKVRRSSKKSAQLEQNVENLREDALALFRVQRALAIEAHGGVCHLC